MNNDLNKDVLQKTVDEFPSENKSKFFVFKENSVRSYLTVNVFGSFVGGPFLLMAIGLGQEGSLIPRWITDLLFNTGVAGVFLGMICLLVGGIFALKKANKTAKTWLKIPIIYAVVWLTAAVIVYIFA